MITATSLLMAIAVTGCGGGKPGAVRTVSVRAVASPEVELYKTLTAEQRSKCTFPMASENEVLLAGGTENRPGVPVRDMSDGQKALVQQLVDEYLQDVGGSWPQHRTGLLRSYELGGGRDAAFVTYFGAPGQPGGYKFRIDALWGSIGIVNAPPTK